MPFGHALQNLVNDFNTQSGGTASRPSQAYQVLVNALNASPPMLSVYNTVADSGELTAIKSTSNQGQSVPYRGYFTSDGKNSNGLYTGTLTFDEGFLKSKVDTLAVVNIMAHEVQHLVNSAGVAQARATLNQQVNSYYADTSNTRKAPMDVTGIVQTHVTTGLNDEGLANIVAWNDVIAAAVTANKGKPIPQIDLVNFSLSQTSVVMFLGHGYDKNNDPKSESYGMVKVSDANIAKAGIALAPARGTGGSAEGSYQEAYTIRALNDIATNAKGNHFAVDFSKIGLPATDMADLKLIKQGFAEENSGKATIINSADNTVHEFSTTTNSGVTSINAKTMTAKGEMLSESTRTLGADGATTTVLSLYDPATGKTFEKGINYNNEVELHAKVVGSGTEVTITSGDGKASRTLQRTDLNLKLDYIIDNHGTLKAQIKNIDGSQIDGNKNDIKFSIHGINTSQNEASAIFPQALTNHIVANAKMNNLTPEATATALQLAQVHYLQDGRQSAVAGEQVAERSA